jgi:hypothetical protein
LQIDGKQFSLRLEPRGDCLWLEDYAFARPLLKLLEDVGLERGVEIFVVLNPIHD